MWILIEAKAFTKDTEDTCARIRPFCVSQIPSDLIQII